MRKKVEKNTAAKRAVEKRAVSAVKPAETEVKEVKAEAAPEAVAAETVSAVKAEEKPEVKAAEAEVQAEAKPAPKAAAKKTTKTAATKKTTKAAAKKETEPKAAKTTKAAASQKIVLQLGGKGDLSMEDIINRVKDAYAAEGHSAASVKNIEVYIKPEENMAYYVIDGYASGISLY